MLLRSAVILCVKKIHKKREVTINVHHKPHFAAEIYKSYLHCASKIIRCENGVITAFDGDRVMGIFIGDLKNTSAAVPVFP